MIVATAGRGIDGAVASTTWRAVAEPAEGFRDQPGRPASAAFVGGDDRGQGVPALHRCPVMRTSWPSGTRVGHARRGKQRVVSGRYPLSSPTQLASLIETALLR